MLSGIPSPREHKLWAKLSPSAVSAKPRHHWAKWRAATACQSRGGKII